MPPMMPGGGWVAEALGALVSAFASYKAFACRGAWERLVLLGNALAKHTPVAPAPDSVFHSLLLIPSTLIWRSRGIWV